VLVVLWFNIANLGVIGGFMVGAGRSDVFYGLLLPHGLLELTIIFVAAGAGLRLGWSWIAPGKRTRGEALAVEGRAVAALALGLAVWLLLSGLVEGFVTPSTLPAGARLLSARSSGWPSWPTSSSSAVGRHRPARPAMSMRS
jgi:uncharacterized membrane protein SpoIIM required for sporulation